MSAPLLAVEREPLRQGGSQGAPRETRGPASGMLFILLLAAGLVAGTLHVLDPRTLPIRQVRIDGEFRHLAPADLQALAGDIVRGGFFNVNVDTVRRVLMEEPWVRNVAVRRIWPDGLSVHVEEQEAAAAWGADALLNTAGEVFAPARETFPQALPALAGPEGAQVRMLDRYRVMQGALDASGLRIASLRLSPRRSWSLTLESGTVVVLGRREVMARFDRFAAMLPGLLRSDLEGAAVIDMRYTNGFAVRRAAPGAGRESTGRESNGQES